MEMDGIMTQINAVVAESEADGQRSDLRVNRQWTCENGHVLGVSVRVRAEAQIKGKKTIFFVDRLLKFRHAIDTKSESPAAVEVDCEIEGTAYDIRCDVEGCNAVRTWHMGEAALERFLETRRGAKEA